MPHNGADDVIFAGNRDFFSEVPAFLRFRRNQNEAYKRLLETAKSQAALALAPGPAADHSVQLVPARRSVSIPAASIYLLSQQRRMQLHGRTENREPG